MQQMPIGMITLLVAIVLIYFGIAQRLLDRMRLTDRAAIGFLAAMLVGTYIPDIPLGPRLSINVGGGLIPAGFALYLWFTADEAKERWRALYATAIAAVLVYGASAWLPSEPDTTLIEPMFAYAIVAGLTAYFLGRSRRAAFIAGVLAIVINDVVFALQVAGRGLPGATTIGGAGIFDATILAGLLAVALAEIIGETKERLVGGHPHPPRQRERGNDEVEHARVVKLETALRGKEVKKIEGRDDE